jgi:hypothetical protein
MQVPGVAGSVKPTLLIWILESFNNTQILKGIFANYDSTFVNIDMGFYKTQRAAKHFIIMAGNTLNIYLDDY